MDFGSSAPLGIALLGLLLGMRHATDPDHVIAVTTILSRERRLAAAARIGVVWGLGHSITVLAVGAAIIVFKLDVPVRVGLAMEFAVTIAVLPLISMAMYLSGFRSPGLLSVRNPDRSTVEKPIDDTDPVGEEQAEGETQKPRTDDQPAVERGHSGRCEDKWRRDSGRDQSHPNHRTRAEDRQVKRGPERFRNGAQDQQRDRRAAREPMDQSDAKGLEHAPARSEQR